MHTSCNNYCFWFCFSLVEKLGQDFKPITKRRNGNRIIIIIIISITQPSLQHRREVATVTVLYKMHTSRCPRDLQELLPRPYTSGRTTGASSSMPNHALAMPHAKTSTLHTTFLHSAIRIWNALPDIVVGKIKSDSVQFFKQRVNKHMMSLCG